MKYFRINDAGDSLSASWRSQHQQEIESVELDGTSACGSFEDLIRYARETGQTATTRTADVIVFEGRSIGRGHDGYDVVVVPEREIARYRGTPAAPAKWAHVDDATPLAEQGFVAVEIMEVAE